jgi:hypothetical protein
MAPNRPQTLIRLDVSVGSKCEELTMSTCFPLCRRTRTLPDAVGTSHLCQRRKSRSRPARSIADAARGEQPNEHGRTSTAASLWKPCFAEAIDINLRPLTAKSYIFGYSEIGINLKELDYRLPGFCIAPEMGQS